MNIGVLLQRIKTEDMIWLVYIFIALAAISSNRHELAFLFTGNSEEQKKFKTINIAVFVIAFFVYLYFVLINYQDIKNLRRDATKKEVITSHLALVASLLFLVGGIIYIIVEINRDTPIDDVGLG